MKNHGVLFFLISIFSNTFIYSSEKKELKENKVNRGEKGYISWALKYAEDDFLNNTEHDMDVVVLVEPKEHENTSQVDKLEHILKKEMSVKSFKDKHVIDKASYSLSDNIKSIRVLNRVGKELSDNDTIMAAKKIRVYFQR